MLKTLVRDLPISTYLSQESQGEKTSNELQFFFLKEGGANTLFYSLAFGF